MSFFSIAPAIIFSHSGKLAGIILPQPTIRLPKTSSWMENCTKFGQLIISKIIKTVATSCEIFRLKYTKFDFGWGSAPDPAGGAYSAPPDPLAGFKGPTSKERRGKGKGGMGEEGKGEKRGGREERGRGEERVPPPPFAGAPSVGCRWRRGW